MSQLDYQALHWACLPNRTVQMKHGQTKGSNECIPGYAACWPARDELVLADLMHQLAPWHPSMSWPELGSDRQASSARGLRRLMRA